MSSFFISFESILYTYKIQFSIWEKVYAEIMLEFYGIESTLLKNAYKQEKYSSGESFYFGFIYQKHANWCKR